MAICKFQCFLMFMQLSIKFKQPDVVPLFKSWRAESIYPEIISKKSLRSLSAAGVTRPSHCIMEKDFWQMYLSKQRSCSTQNKCLVC